MEDCFTLSFSDLIALQAELASDILSNPEFVDVSEDFKKACVVGSILLMTEIFKKYYDYREGL